MKIKRKSFKKSGKSIKNKHSNNLIIPIIIAVFLVILGVLIIKNTFNFFGKTNNNSLTNSELSGNNNLKGNEDNGIVIDDITMTDSFYVGDEVSLTGIIIPAQSLDQSFYSHLFMINSEIKFGLKSKQHLLSEYEGNAKIFGVVSDIRKGIPVVQVGVISKIDDLVDEQDEEEIIEVKEKNNDYYFPNQGIAIKFGMFTGYIVENVGSELNIYQVNDTGTGENQLVAQIFPFECVKGSSTKDCSKLQSQFKNYGFADFISSNGIQFYKKPETDAKIFFNGDSFGYNIIPTKSGLIDSLSRYIYFEDYSTIKTNISKNIQNICSKSDLTLTKITNFNIVFQNGDMIGIIDGNDDLGNNLLCEIQIVNTDAIVANLKSLQKVSKNNTNTINNSLQGDIQNSTGNDTSENIIGQATTTMKFTSNRGFSINMPSNIAYEGVNITPVENLGINGVKCDYKINMINYKNKDNLSISPSVEAFFCEYNIDNSSIPSNYVLLKGTLSEKVFLIRPNDDDGKVIISKINLE